MRKRKESLIMIIILLVLFLGVGYAYLTTTLNINGTTDVDANTWNVYWDNVQVTTGSVTGTQVTQAPTISNQTTVSFHIRLKEPGEYYEFTVDAKNDGTIDAMIDTINKTINGNTTTPSYLKYTVTYVMGSEIQEKQLLRANSIATYKVRVEYRDDINPSSLPSTAVSLDIGFQIEYVQKNSTAIDNRQIVYTKSYNTSIGRPFLEPYSFTYYVYNTPQEIMTAENVNVFIKIIAENDTVIDGELVIVQNNNIYYFKGGGSTYNETTGEYNEDSIYYDSNITKLKEVFGEENCGIHTYYGGYQSFECASDDVRAFSSKDGSIQAGAYGLPYACGVFPNGEIGCGG